MQRRIEDVAIGRVVDVQHLVPCRYGHMLRELVIERAERLPRLFGAGAEKTWQALGTLNYELTEHVSVSAGYKVLDVDYAADGHVFDTTLQGPALGVTYRF